MKGNGKRGGEFVELLGTAALRGGCNAPGYMQFPSSAAHSSSPSPITCRGEVGGGVSRGGSGGAHPAIVTPPPGRFTLIGAVIGPLSLRPLNQKLERNTFVPGGNVLGKLTSIFVPRPALLSNFHWPRFVGADSPIKLKT